MSVLVPTLFVLMLYKTLSVKAAELALHLCHEASTGPQFREGCAAQAAPGAALEVPLLPVPRPEIGGVTFQSLRKGTWLGGVACWSLGVLDSRSYIFST